MRSPSARAPLGFSAEAAGQTFVLGKTDFRNPPRKSHSTGGARGGHGAAPLVRLAHVPLDPAGDRRAALHARGRGDGAQRPLAEPADGSDPAHARLRQVLARRRGCPPDRRARRAVPRPVRRLRGVRDRPQPPRGDRRGAGDDAGGDRQPAPARRDAPERRARGAAARPRARQRRGDGSREHGDRGGRGRDQGLARRDGPPADPPCRARLPRPDARLALAERRADLPRGLRPAAAGLRSGPLRRRRGPGARARSGRRRGVRGRAGSGKGREPPAARLPPARAGPLPRRGDAVRLRRGADGNRSHGALPRARALGP